MEPLENINQYLTSQAESGRILWAVRTFSEHLGVTTSFGTYSAVMLHLVRQYAPETVIISIDTGHNQETKAFADELIRLLQLNVHRYRIPELVPDTTGPAVSMEEYVQTAKVDLLEKAFKEHQIHAWMSGLQKNETDHRRDFQFIMQRADGMYKFHPLLDWDSRRLYAYCKEHGLPVNDHYYDPAKGPDQSSECGIHLTGLANESFTSSEL